ncbi:Histone acetyltransferase Tip60 [Neolecta irregularis DAH-3]|uniref:histone acetyltransferase n=1 Tax=Neolecta irregularis (strain DAH-3) TaxID=1198029 RepID=A0A1U7LHP4_NEOID|nr:Histone acetyltransferase Tip60 [Neolecta irregularis DAH-3]|eukprot:OLL22180.1 Histone acetyltransferase Tip60 [Neolecta irregularis DAH-3]
MSLIPSNYANEFCDIYNSLDSTRNQWESRLLMKLDLIMFIWAKLVKNASSLYVCLQCFKYSIDPSQMEIHRSSCDKSVPGQSVYCKKNYKLFRVDGDQDKVMLFCQCLSLFAKMFLDEKTIYYDVDGFYFYVLGVFRQRATETSTEIIGFFSREKRSWDEYNLACILVFPQFQGRGYGQLLIDFSYEISRLRNKIESPESPLSAQGLNTYQKYWKSKIAQLVVNGCETGTAPEKWSINAMSQILHIRPEDVESALLSMNLNIQKSLITNTEVYRVSKARLKEYIPKKTQHVLDRKCLEHLKEMTY